MFARAHVFEERDLSTCDAKLSFFPINLFFPIQRLATQSRSDKNLWTSEQVFAKQL